MAEERAMNGRWRRWLDWRHWRDVIFATDPGWKQTRQAARATLAAIVATLVLFHLIRWLHEPKTVAFIGIFVSILGSVLVNDPTPARQRITLLLVPLAAASTLTIGTLVAPIWWLNNLVFVAVIFVAVSVRQFGPRFLTLGFIGYMAYFISLFFHAKFADLPWLLGGIAVGAALAYALRFWIWPDRPEKIFAQTVRAYRAQLRRVVQELALTLAGGRWRPRDRQRFNQLIGVLNELALTIEDAAGSLGKAEETSELSPDFRQWILELELTVESMAEAVRRLLKSGGVTAELGSAISQSLSAVWNALEENGSAASFENLADEIRAAPRKAGGTPDRLAAKHFAEALRDLGAALQRSERYESAAAPAVCRSAQDEKKSSAASQPDDGLTFRRALQAAIAAALAIAAGEAISQTRWYWAVIAAFVVFSRTTTSAETLVKGWQRILGTIVGVAVGLALGEAVLGHHWLQIVLLYVCIFFAFLLIRISYAWMIIWFTLLLVVLYGLLGLLTPGLLGLRLLLTLVGAVVGVLCATFILPARTSDKVRTAALAVLRASGAFLARGLTEKPGLAEQARDLDAKLQELRQAASPLQSSFLPVEGRDQNPLAQATMVLGFLARQLVAMGPQEAVGRTRLKETADALAANARELVEALEEERPPEIESVLPKMNEAEEGEKRDANASRLRHWLRRIDGQLLRIAEVAGTS